MKILIVTLADEPYWPLARISVPNKAAYAAKHGYDFLYISESWWPDWPTSMSKMPVIAHYFQDYDWVFWTDIDSLIINQSLPLEGFMGPVNGDLIVHANSDGINCGQMLVVGDSPWFADTYLKFCKDVDKWAQHPWWEQAAIQHYVKSANVGYVGGEFNRMVRTGPEDNDIHKIMRKMDFQGFKKTDFIWHFAGIGGERAHLRLELMEELAK